MLQETQLRRQEPEDKTQDMKQDTKDRIKETWNKREEDRIKGQKTGSKRLQTEDKILAGMETVERIAEARLLPEPTSQWAAPCSPPPACPPCSSLARAASTGGWGTCPCPPAPPLPCPPPRGPPLPSPGEPARSWRKTQGWRLLCLLRGGGVVLFLGLALQKGTSKSAF